MDRECEILKKRFDILDEQIDIYMKKFAKSKEYIEYLRTKKYGYKKIALNFIGDSVLELGSDGAATSSILVRWSKNLTIIDMIDKLSSLRDEDSEIKRAKFIQKRWEEYKCKKLYSDILLTDSLEHVEEPIEILKLAKCWLRDGGKIHIVVPNALSLHRLVGVEMGLLETPYSFNKNDIRSGHKRVYDFVSLKKDIESSKLEIIKMEGVQLKPLSDGQLSTFSDSFKDALDRLSYISQEHCAEIYVCCG